MPRCLCWVLGCLSGLILGPGLLLQARSCISEHIGSVARSVPAHLWNGFFSTLVYKSVSPEAGRCYSGALDSQSWKKHLDHVLQPLHFTDRETETQRRERAWQTHDQSGAGTSLSQLGVRVGGGGTRGEEPVSITKMWAQASSGPLGQLGSWLGTEGVFPRESLLE